MPPVRGWFETLNFVPLHTYNPNDWLGLQAQPSRRICHAVEGDLAVDILAFVLLCREFQAINAGSLFKVNPSVSFQVICETTGEVDAIWEKLSEGGMALIELGAMDSAYEHTFEFNEAICFIVNCDTLKEIDYYKENFPLCLRQSSAAGLRRNMASHSRSFPPSWTR